MNQLRGLWGEHGCRWGRGSETQLLGALTPRGAGGISIQTHGAALKTWTFGLDPWAAGPGTILSGSFPDDSTVWSLENHQEG